MRLNEKVLMTILVLLFTGGSGIAQDIQETDASKHEFGAGFILPLEGNGHSRNKILNFSYKYHFHKGALRTTLHLGNEKSVRYNDPDYYTSLDRELGTFLGYEFFQEFGRFRMHYGADLGAFLGMSGSTREIRTRSAGR